MAKDKFKSGYDIEKWMPDILSTSVVKRSKTNPTEQSHDDIMADLRAMQLGEMIGSNDPYYDEVLTTSNVNDVFDRAARAQEQVQEVLDTQVCAGATTAIIGRMESLASRIMKRVYRPVKTGGAPKGGAPEVPATPAKPDPEPEGKASPVDPKQTDPPKVRLA